MTLQQSIDGKNALTVAIRALTPWAFVRAAGLASLLVVTIAFKEFIAIDDGMAFQVELVLVLYATLVIIWGAAAVLCVVALASRRLATVARRLIGPARSSSSGRSRVWDEWLDNPGGIDSRPLF
jgi:hypothetical protein